MYRLITGGTGVDGKEAFVVREPKVMELAVAEQAVSNAHIGGPDAGFGCASASRGKQNN